MTKTREAQPAFSRRSAMVKAALVVFAMLAATGAFAEQRFPEVVSVQVRASANGTFDFDVTVSSPYDTPDRYADGFRVVTKSGQVLGERKLWHDHQNEQPFTRDLYSVKIPPTIKSVWLQARDQKYGYGSQAVEVGLPGR